MWPRFLAHAIFDEGDMRRWAWRVPIFLGFLLSLVAFALQRAARTRPEADSDVVVVDHASSTTISALHGGSATASVDSREGEGEGAENVSGLGVLWWVGSLAPGGRRLALAVSTQVLTCLLF